MSHQNKTIVYHPWKIISNSLDNNISTNESVQYMFDSTTSELKLHWLLDHFIEKNKAENKLQESIEKNMKECENNLLIKNTQCLNTEIKR